MVLGDPRNSRTVEEGWRVLQMWNGIEVRFGHPLRHPAGRRECGYKCQADAPAEGMQSGAHTSVGACGTAGMGELALRKLPGAHLYLEVKRVRTFKKKS